MAIAPSEGPGLPMYKTYYESAPGVIRSTGEPAISRSWEAADGTGMWRQSNYWGNMTSSISSLKGASVGREVEPGFFVFDHLVTGFVKFSDMRPMA
jgi:hypothetical protein